MLQPTRQRAAGHEHGIAQQLRGDRKRAEYGFGEHGFSALRPSIKGRQTGVFQMGGFPDLDSSFLFCPFLSFLGLSRFFWDFPDLLGDGPGIFPICPFPLSRPIKSTYEEQSRKGPRHNLDLSRKKWETPGFGNTPV